MVGVSSADADHMQTDITSLIGRLKETADKLPPPPKMELIQKPTEKCACGKIVEVSLFSQANTGVFTAPSGVCAGCKEGEKLIKECSSVYCARCKRLICWIKPHKDKDGFEYVPGKAYHLSFCGVCSDVAAGTMLECPIIEKVLYSRGRKNSK